MFKDFEFKDRMFLAITDLLALSIFLGIQAPVREAINAINRGDKGKDISPFKNYLKQVWPYINNML